MKTVEVLGEQSSRYQISTLGYEQNGRAAWWGPGARNVWILHYVLTGEGYFNGERVGRGQGFLICPGTLHEYHPEPANPWNYFWIQFTGRAADDLMKNSLEHENNHVFSISFIDRVEQLLHAVILTSGETAVPLFAEGCFDLLMSFHQRDLPRTQKLGGSVQDRHVEKAMRYFQDNFHRGAKVGDAAAYLHIDDQYLYNLFIKKAGQSPQQYLTGLRIKYARHFLCNTDLSISEVAQSVGYSDVLQFSRFFKTKEGVSPTEYRKNMQKEHL